MSDRKQTFGDLDETTARDIDRQAINLWNQMPDDQQTQELIAERLTYWVKHSWKAGRRRKSLAKPKLVASNAVSLSSRRRSGG